MNKRKGKIFRTSWRGRALLGAGAVVLLGSGIFSTASAETPERCFGFNNGTITRYLKGSYPECGTDVTIPIRIGRQNVTAIGDRAFHNKGLTSLVLPHNLTTIGENAFSINKLTSLTIPSSVTTIKNVAFTRNQLTSLIIPASVRNLGTFAFDQNRLTSVSSPDGMTEIPLAAFRHNQLTSVIIPTSVTKVGGQAFAANPGLPSLGGKVEVRFGGNPRAINIASDANIHLVSSSIDDCFDFDAAKGEITNYKK